MPGIFAVINERGPAWDHSVGLEQQAQWREHAAFMDGLHEDGFALLVGPLEGTNEVLLILRAEDPDEIARRLAQDCWMRSGQLRLGRIMPWTLRLGAVSV